MWSSVCGISEFRRRYVRTDASSVAENQIAVHLTPAAIGFNLLKHLSG